MLVGESEDAVAGFADLGLQLFEQDSEGMSDCLVMGLLEPVLEGLLRLNLALILPSTLIRGGRPIPHTTLRQHR